jgi:hypothetical protein
VQVAQERVAQWSDVASRARIGRLDKEFGHDSSGLRADVRHPRL